MAYPSSNEDYLKALEEAYRQGAAAAAQMALQEQQQSMHSRASCPNFAGHVLVPNSNNNNNNNHNNNSNNNNNNTQYSTILPISVPDPLLHFTMPPPQQQQQQQQQQHRSFSLPDMSAYASQKQEDMKRHKRLARNRASARLRRLRKKQLVDDYETQVKSLECNLQQLQQHEWGGHAESNLVQLLSMERGQEELPQVQEAVAALLSQQLQVVQQLQELMQEQYALYEVAANDCAAFDELAALLELTDSQRTQIQTQAHQWMEEWQALQVVEESLRSVQENEWLSNNGVSEMVEQLYALLNKNQLSKFFIWTDVNRDAIDCVNIVSMAEQQDGPVFQFGVENAADDGRKNDDDDDNNMGF